MNDYNVVQLDAITIRYLGELYKDVYKKDSAENYFRLKYNTAYTGQQYIGFFALYNQKPVAFYGVIPVRMSIKNSPVLAAQSCDTMTHPDHRKKGLFVMLAERTFELAKKKDINFVFGFPNANSYPAFVNQLGFKHVETMNRYTLQFSDNWIKKIYRKFLVSSSRNQSLTFKNSLLEQDFDGCIYDDIFFKYKGYNKNFILTREQNSYWINKNGNVFVGALSDESSETLPGHILLLRKASQAASLTFMISKGTRLDFALSKLYKADEGFPVILKDLSGNFALENLKFQFADIDIF